MRHTLGRTALALTVGAGAIVPAGQLHHALAGPVAIAAAQKAPVNETARRLAEFRRRVDEYLALRHKAASGTPRAGDTRDPAKSKAAQDALRSRMQSLRAGAQPGDIFTTEVRPIFRRLLAPALKGQEGRDAQTALKDDAPSSVPLKVNSRYPEAAPLPTMPPNILKTLPPLPEELEYRLVKKDLLLFDPETELIVDYIAHAIR